MLRGWWMRLARISDVRDKCTVPHRPDIRPLWNSQELIYEYPASLLFTGERRDEGARHRSRGPHQSARWNRNAIGQKNLAFGHAFNPDVKANFHVASGEDLLSVSSQTFTQFRQNR